MKKLTLALSVILLLSALTGCSNIPYIEEISVATPWTFCRYASCPEGGVYGYEAAGQHADAEDRLYNLRGQIYNRAIAYKDEGLYSEATILFTMLGDYLSSAEQAVECKAIQLDNQYALADHYEASGDLQNAYALFNGLSGFRDAAERAEALAPQLGIELENRDKYFD